MCGAKGNTAFDKGCVEGGSIGALRPKLPLSSAGAGTFGDKETHTSYCKSTACGKCKGSTCKAEPWDQLLLPPAPALHSHTCGICTSSSQHAGMEHLPRYSPGNHEDPPKQMEFGLWYSAKAPKSSVFLRELIRVICSYL